MTACKGLLDGFESNPLTGSDDQDFGHAAVKPLQYGPEPFHSAPVAPIVTPVRRRPEARPEWPGRLAPGRHGKRQTLFCCPRTYSVFSQVLVISIGSKSASEKTERVRCSQGQVGALTCYTAHGLWFATGRGFRLRWCSPRCASFLAGPKAARIATTRIRRPADRPAGTGSSQPRARLPRDPTVIGRLTPSSIRR